MSTANYKKGFTIVETLVAITVLMIAIAGPLVVASRGLVGASLSKNQMVASYLAQESMEAIKNIRDNNIYNGANWLTNLVGCTIAAPCDASAIDGASQMPSIKAGCASMCPIYIENNGYGHYDGAASIFSRRFYLHEPDNTNSCQSIYDECGATVEVEWYEGPTLYRIAVNSAITSSLR